MTAPAPLRIDAIVTDGECPGAGGSGSPRLKSECLPRIFNTSSEFRLSESRAVTVRKGAASSSAPIDLIAKRDWTPPAAIPIF